MSATYQTIRYEPHPPIAEIVLDRPSHGNTFTRELLAELADATCQLATEDGIRAVVLRGEGKNFCFGADVDMFVDAGTANPRDCCATSPRGSTTRSPASRGSRSQSSGSPTA